MYDLDKLRKEIDCVDKQIIEAFEKRMKIVENVALYKKENNLPILNKNREEGVIKENCRNIKNINLKHYAEEFIKELMEISREYQYNIINADNNDTGKLKVGVLGIPGSFSEQALYDYFGNNVIACYTNDFENIFMNMKNDEINFGILPIENSSTGAISEVYDLLNKYNFYIVGEKYEKIEHCLMGVKGSKIEDIKEVYSHAQGLGQCRDFLKKFPYLKLKPYSSTAKSAELVKKSNDKSKAAIGSNKASIVYDLDILAENININKNNTTRFVVIGKNIDVHSNCSKVSIIFSTAHKSGSLFNVLKHFAQDNINLLKIESRPMKDRPFEYYFYVDFEGNIGDKKIESALSMIAKNCYYLKIIGNYQSDKIVTSL